MTIDHVTLPVREYTQAKRFYAAALRPLGFTLLLDWPDGRRAWFGVDGAASSLWLAESDRAGTLEVCLAAARPEGVERFHAEAVGAGAASKWEPGIRPEFNRDYYAARVRDPDGNSIEVVYRGEVASGTLDQPVAA